MNDPQVYAKPEEDIQHESDTLDHVATFQISAKHVSMLPFNKIFEARVIFLQNFEKKNRQIIIVISLEQLSLAIED